MIYSTKGYLLPIILILLLLGTFSSRAETPLTLGDIVEWGQTEAPGLEELQDEITELERQLERVRASFGWQLDFSGSTRFDLDEREFQEEQVVLDLQKSFLSGINLLADITYREQLVIPDFPDDNDWPDELETEYEPQVSVAVSYTIFPPTPSPFYQEKFQQEKLLERRKNNLNQELGEEFLGWIQSYLALITQEKALQFSREDVNRLEQELQEIQEQKEIGEAGEINVLDAELALKQAENSYQKRAEALEQEKDDFYEMLGLPPQADLKLKLESEFLDDLYSWLEELNLEEQEQEVLLDKLGEHPRLMNLETEKKQLQQEIDWLGWERWPQVDLTGTGRGWEDDWDGQIGIELNYSIYDSGQHRLQQEEAGDELQDLEAEIENQKENLEKQLQTLQQNLDNSRNELEVNELRFQREKMEKDLNKEDFDLGLITRRDLNQAITAKKEARLDLIEARHEVLLNRLHLAHFLGYYYFEWEEMG